jgi:hypothetical protein
LYFIDFKKKCPICQIGNLNIGFNSGLRAKFMCNYCFSKLNQKYKSFSTFLFNILNDISYRFVNPNQASMSVNITTSYYLLKLMMDLYPKKRDCYV